jgi:hypothetical protein
MVWPDSAVQKEEERADKRGHMAVTRETKGITTEMRKPEEKVPFWQIRQGASGRLN